MDLSRNLWYFLVINLKAYVFYVDALKLIHDYFYLSNWKQRVKVIDAYSSWKEIFYRFIPVPLLLIIHLCGLFFLEDLDIASDADDTTIYMVNEKKSQ